MNYSGIMMEHKIKVRLHICVNQVIGYERDGEPITKYISTIVDRIINCSVKDNEYEVLLKAYMTRDDDYYAIDLAEIHGCEWLFYKLVWDDWKMIIDEYCKMNVVYTIKNPHLYRIELPNNMIIYPSLTLKSLEHKKSKVDIESIPEKTIFKELPDGLELIRVGRDFPNFSRSNVDELNLNGYGPNETFPLDKIVKIGEIAFIGYNGILHLNLPNCKEVGHHAFNRCAGLKSIIMPKLEHIEMDAFNECHFLRTFSYPKNLIDIEEGAFYGCMNLSGFLKDDGTIVTTLPDRVKVGGDAFAYTPLDHLSNNLIYVSSIRNVDDI